MKPFAEGGLPDKARERIAAAKSSEKRFFTTTFTVAEMAIARLAGYEPISQVMGSSIYHVGWNSLRGYGGGELDAITRAKRNARLLALGRMEEEATLLGASAVIGVKLNVRGYEWAGELSEFTAVGTAVRASGPVPARPALTNLSVQQLYKLEQAELWPLGIAMGNCTWYADHADCASDGSWTNQELPAHTRVIEAARSHATARFKQELVDLHAAGAVNVEVKRNFHEHEWERDKREHIGFLAEMMLLGTAVQSRGPHHAIPRPKLVLNLSGTKIDLRATAHAEFVKKEE